MPEINRIYQGDSLAVLKTWPAGFVHCAVTSPPYWGLRDYGVAGQLGLEKTPWEYIEKMVAVFAEVRRVLRDDGTLWLNIGDCYASNSAGARVQTGFPRNRQRAQEPTCASNKFRGDGIKAKDLIGMPWMLALALRSDGWYLRSEIIWHKKNPMPESVYDRPAKAHEQLFLLSKSPKYYYDFEAIKELASEGTHSRGNGVNPKCAGYADGPGSHSPVDHAKPAKEAGRDSQALKTASKFSRGPGWRVKQNASMSGAISGNIVSRRNKRTVWSITSEPLPEKHFAAFPQKLIEPCILAGCPGGGVVLDPFMGAGTTALVAARLNRNFIGIELNPEYIAMAERRIAAEVSQIKFL